MLKEKILEAKIIDAIEAAIPATAPRHVVAGFWQPSAVGTLKGIEKDSDSIALIEVATGLGSQQTFSDPCVNFSVTVQLTVRIELDANGNHILTFTEPLSELFKSWMSATYQQTFTALDVDGLSIDEVGVSGSQPTIDAQAMVAAVKWELSLSGTYTQPNNNTNN